MAETTLDRAEIDRFSALAREWWDPDGPFRPLHKLNPVRMAYLAERIGARFDRPAPRVDRLAGLKILDIGSGGGLVAEPLARLGAAVTGIDPSEMNVTVAGRHAAEEGLAIDYLAVTAESLAESRPGAFDVVLALEVIEHVADPALFVAACRQLVRPEGLVVFSTLNRTAKSLALGKIGAEYVLGWLPKGTHSWRRFVRPSELARLCRAGGLEIDDLTGLVYRPAGDRFVLAKDIDVNYFATARPR